MANSVRKLITIDGKVVCRYFPTNEAGEAWLDSVRETASIKDLDGEIWNDIPNFSRYKASNFGRIVSLNYKNSKTRKLINPTCNQDGYPQSMFKGDDGKYHTKKIHSLIALAFLGERDKGLEVNHIDGNKENASISNLEYITHSQNCQHSFDTKLQKAKRGDLNGMAKLTWEQVRYIREQKANGGRNWGRDRIAKELGISSAHVKDIANNPNLWREE